MNSVWFGFGLLALLSLSGCDHYGVNADLANTVVSPPPPQTAYSSWINAEDLYTVIWAETLQPNGSQVGACSQPSLLNSLFSSRQRTITVSADISSTVSLPLYAVSQDGSSSCSVRYSQIFLAPRQTIDPTLPFTITGSAIVDDQGTERVSEYLKAGASFASLIAPLVPQAGVVAGGINTALQSDAGKALSNEASGFVASKISIGGTPLVSLQPQIAAASQPIPLWSQTSWTYKINLIRYHYNNTPYVETPADLGSLIIHVLRTSTIIGVDPVTSSGQLNSGPSYDNLSGATQVFTFASSPAGVFPQQNNLQTMLDANANVVAAVQALPASDTTDQVKTACGNLRNGLLHLDFLNSIDQAAYLWWAYSQSSYANAHETAVSLITTLGPCLIQSEQSKILELGIGNWPHRYGT